MRQKYVAYLSTHKTYRQKAKYDASKMIDTHGLQPFSTNFPVCGQIYTIPGNIPWLLGFFLHKNS